MLLILFQEKDIGRFVYAHISLFALSFGELFLNSTLLTIYIFTHFPYIICI